MFSVIVCVFALGVKFYFQMLCFMDLVFLILTNFVTSYMWLYLVVYRI